MTHSESVVGVRSAVDGGPATVYLPGIGDVSGPVGRGVEGFAPARLWLNWGTSGWARPGKQVVLEVFAVRNQGEAQDPARGGGAPVGDGLPVRPQPGLDAGVCWEPTLYEVLGLVDIPYEVVPEVPTLAVPAHRGGLQHTKHVAGLGDLAVIHPTPTLIGVLASGVRRLALRAAGVGQRPGLRERPMNHRVHDGPRLG